jgi:xanthine/uracil permease
MKETINMNRLFVQWIYAFSVGMLCCGLSSLLLWLAIKTPNDLVALLATSFTSFGFWGIVIARMKSKMLDKHEEKDLLKQANKIVEEVKNANP